MDKDIFIATIAALEADLRRRGLTLEQIEQCEITALNFTRQTDSAEAIDYLRTVYRLANSGLY